MFLRGDLQEICDFSLQVHLGMESIHDWWKQKAEKKRRQRDLRTKADTASGDIRSPP
jgi:hypothetical protein